ncbi:3-oxoacyl-ACP synthase [Bordetella pertussis]|uniref:Beta-ketoacyl-[acyl-carrier-protein] synthase III n=4 Tax=Bordetella pertussis TaxID=520 RepID=FABH_BORPE|nr:beta-ketoacyl-ACP synthase III [Bordetella pertussis]Q7VW29.1 RecName: Full=Beta-ketoacyl-[acyl-carrier-protein] synthase III; Short=Beta-ketoacyl-ACP synthase III; Short=KAS III; AltName: Full=3-oxoacyl-[acyl-carrier-protein] synthase 3; AltName: Full=3-oxoacyl-[acyl-carrier-protein] synthase III [Bordetella pertussis Tohama I]AEE67683.1 3-oxoacyl-(acyl carrier protein) synthase III [Bordetella pertussis CS]AIW92678.1 3-oxoacyl-ACP synthase [Bordetella pertussis B1917]AIW96185.1 3-oxoacyl-A
MEKAMKYAKIAGSGGYLPERVVTNDDLAAELATRQISTSDEWIVERTGIRQRHLAERGVTTSQLATEAARRAMDDAGVQADEIDMIIVATSTPDYVFPSTACLVQANLGAKGGAAFDVQAVCSGFVYAMTTADNFIRAGRARCALVIGAEVFSRILDWNDRGTCVLFGDGAGAVVLKAADEPGILAAHLHADGSQTKILCAAGNVAYGDVTGDPFLRMDGQAVFKQAVTVLDRSARDVCAEAGVEVDDIDWLIPHQANVRILNFLARKLRVPTERVVITMDQHANTSAASVPLALDVARRDGRVKPGQLVLMQGVGGGFTWGSVLARM